MASSVLEASGNDSNTDWAILKPFSHAENWETKHPMPTDNARPSPQHTRKRRRILHACDECRRKKIKCDGTKPCIHCAVYGYECTYDDPSKRGRNTPLRYTEAVEARLQRAEGLLRILEPTLDFKDLYLDTNSLQQIATNLRRRTPDSGTAGRSATTVESVDDLLPGIMVERLGSLDLDDKGRWNYNGSSSTTIFMQRLQNQFGNLVAPIPAEPRFGIVAHISSDKKLGIDLPKDLNYLSNPPPGCDLPSETVARKLCRISFDEACILSRFVHEPSFWASFDQIYATSWDRYGVEERTFAPLLYAAMAVGCLFSAAAGDAPSTAGSDSVVEQGFKYFRTCRGLLDITDCQDLTSLQATIFMILFCQSSVRLSACYPYIGIAQRAALRMGLHRRIQSSNFNTIECELRKRVFWTIQSLDVCISTRLGLPIALNREEIDQEYPLEVDDEFITPAGILSMPSDRISLMAGANAQTHLVDITVRVVRNVYPIKCNKHQDKSDHTYMISYSKIKELERDLNAWMDQLPFASLSSNGDLPLSPDIERMWYLLRLAHAHVQWVMYQPFLHHVSKGLQPKGIDRRPYMCAAACVSVSRKIIQVAGEMHKKGLLSGAYWFPMHSIYFATLTLIYAIIENRELPTVQQDALESAFEGKDILEALARNSLALGRCSRLQSLFKFLPKKISGSSSLSGINDPCGARETVQTQFSRKPPVDAAQPNSSTALLPNAQSLSIFDTMMNQPTAQQETNLLQQNGTSQEVSDLMPIFLPPEFITAQADKIDFNGLIPGEASFDEMFIQFGMEME